MGRNHRKRSSPSDEKIEAEEFHPLDAELSRSAPPPKNENPYGRATVVMYNWGIPLSPTPISLTPVLANKDVICIIELPHISWVTRNPT